MTQHDAFRRELASILGPKGFAIHDDILNPQLTDWRGVYTGKALGLALPATTDEVAEVIRRAAGHAIPIVPQGGNTGLVGGGIPDGSGDALLVNLRRMNQIRSIDPLNHTIT